MNDTHSSDHVWIGYPKTRTFDPWTEHQHLDVNIPLCGIYCKQDIGEGSYDAADLWVKYLTGVLGPKYLIRERELLFTPDPDISLTRY